MGMWKGFSTSLDLLLWNLLWYMSFLIQVLIKNKLISRKYRQYSCNSSSKMKASTTQLLKRKTVAPTEQDLRKKGLALTGDGAKALQQMCTAQLSSAKLGVMSYFFVIKIILTDSLWQFSLFLDRKGAELFFVCVISSIFMIFKHKSSPNAG